MIPPRQRKPRNTPREGAREASMKVSGQAAIVTGGGSGMGAETARRLAAAGARVALLDVNEAAAEAVAREIGGIAGKGDVSSAAGVGGAGREARDAPRPARLPGGWPGGAAAGGI